MTASKIAERNGSPDLSYFRQRYPLTVASFGALPHREAWLSRIWKQDQRWQGEMENDHERVEELIYHGPPPPNLTLEGEFEIIYSGGAPGLLHAATMAARYDRKVLVFNPSEGHTLGNWNLSEGDLREFEQAGLFTRIELEESIVNRYGSGFVKFHDAGSRVKTPPLWMSGVMDVAISSDKLLELAAAKIAASQTGSVLMEGMRVLRCYVEPDRVTIEVKEIRSGKRLGFRSRLFIDALGINSTIARQLNDGDTTMTHVCPTVGTVSRGLSRGQQSDQVDFGIGEILVSNEDASDHRQLIWEGFAGDPKRDEYTTCLFFYDAVNSPANKSLLALFERYFETLPGYKRSGAQWRVMKPLFGYVPGFRRAGWNKRKRNACDHILVIGEAAGLSAPPLCGFGSQTRELKRLTHLADLALEAGLLDEGSLSQICPSERRVAQTASLAEFLRPTPKSAPSTVNETLNAVMAALHSLDEKVRRELFQDRITFEALKKLLSSTVRHYPSILQRVREHLGTRGTFWWMANIADAAFSERRRAKSAQPSESNERNEKAAEKFARYVGFYQQQAVGATVSSAEKTPTRPSTSNSAKSL
jgi:lycopene cyclase CruA